MKINEWLKTATKKFEEAKIPTPRLDSILILSYVLNKPKSWILANPNNDLNRSELEDINKLLSRRQEREPVAYLTQRKEFYGYEFYVNKNVMIPRPETEAMIDFVINHAPENATLVELGTGSGAIALTITKERPDLSVTATDISREALEVAHENQERLKATDIRFKQSDLLGSIDEEYDWLVANLPYVPKDAEITQEATYEPDLALFAEESGVGIYRRLFAEVQNRDSFRTITLEAEPFQRQLLTDITGKRGYKLTHHDKKFLYVFERI